MTEKERHVLALIAKALNKTIPIFNDEKLVVQMRLSVKSNLETARDYIESIGSPQQ